MKESTNTVSSIRHHLKNLLKGSPFYPSAIGLYLRKTRLFYTFRTLPLQYIKEVLDAGCGTGLFAIELARRYPNLSVSGCDLDIKRAEKLRSDLRSDVSFFAADLTSITAQKHWDFVYCCDVLDDIVEYRKAIETLCDILRPGGYLYIHLPLHPRRVAMLRNRRIEEYVRSDNQNSHGRDLNEAELCRILNEKGLTIVRQGYSVGYWGTLAWEMGKLIENNVFLRMLASPILKGLVLVDCQMSNKVGNAFFVLAVRRANVA